MDKPKWHDHDLSIGHPALDGTPIHTCGTCGAVMSGTILARLLVLEDLVTLADQYPDTDPQEFMEMARGLAAEGRPKQPRHPPRPS